MRGEIQTAREGLARARWTVGLAALAAVACVQPSAPTDDDRGAVGREYAIAVHGGAGVMTYAPDSDEARAYLSAIQQVLEQGRRMLDEGDTSLDVVEQLIRLLEDDPRFNAGRGAVFTHDGRHELDASIMDGATLSCGAVAAVTSVKNPISLARLVMQRTPHVLLAGTGAERFADEMGVERVGQQYYYTEQRWEALQRTLAREAAEPGGGTVGVVALDREGRLAAGTSTGGLTNKLAGRIGDTPIIGAGTYADADCASSGTGVGEEFIRHGVARRICLIYEDLGLPIYAAAARVIHERLQPGQGGVIAVTRDGEIAMVFNTPGMYRGAADSTGRFEVAIWE
jgi:beta-aspartyl-peptidase (threonine type)